MSDLLVIAFPTEAKAEEVCQRLLAMQKEYLIELGDAAAAPAPRPERPPAGNMRAAGRRRRTGTQGDSNVQTPARARPLHRSRSRRRPAAEGLLPLRRSSRCSIPIHLPHWARAEPNCRKKTHAISAETK